MPTPKEEVRELLDQLPDDSSLDDIQYHIYVRQKIRNGLAAADQGQMISQDEVEKRMSRWPQSAQDRDTSCCFNWD